MKTLRDTAQQELDEQLTAIKAIRANEAAAMVARNLSRTPALQVRSFFPSVLDLGDIHHDHHPHQTPVLTSLKRKRDDTDKNGDEAVEAEAEAGDVHLAMAKNDENPESGVAVGASAGDVVMKDEAATTLPTITTTNVELAAPLTTRAPDSPPPRKRARRIVRTVARTAGAVTVGAVVTWSALAFS